jgi:hypothetical protein
MLAAGGSSVDRLIVTRPIALIWQSSSAVDRRELLHIAGTGVYGRVYWGLTSRSSQCSIGVGY